MLFSSTTGVPVDAPSVAFISPRVSALKERVVEDARRLVEALTAITGADAVTLPNLLRVLKL